MTRLSKLIAELCPNGVEYKPLEEIATSFSRGSGIKRNEVTADGVPCVRYGEIYTTFNIGFDKCISHTTTEVAKRARCFGHGDILFAITGEKIEDIAKCTAYLGYEKCYAGGDVVVMKHEQNPKYLVYALSTKEAQRQKSKGKVKSKVVHSSVPALKSIVIPVPPLAVQEEIVRFLDAFTDEVGVLTKELEAELVARRKQYEQYRDKLLTFGDSVERRSLGELGGFYSGLTGKCKGDFENGNAKFISYMNVYSNCASRLDVSDKVKVAPDERQNQIQYGDVLFTGSSETPEECAMSSVVTLEVTEPIYLNSFCFGFRLFDKSLYAPVFLKHLLRGTEIRHRLSKTANGVTRFNVSKEKMSKVIIPIPPLAEQKRIVEILDKFDALCNDETAGLAAEIASRKKQYEYYRDKLLTFKKAS